jgi:ribosome-associated translation inhibitor RaiA
MVTVPAKYPARGCHRFSGRPHRPHGQEELAMQVRIHSHGIHTDNELRLAIERRLDLSLGRFESRIHEVRVWLSDDNGPRGGVDKKVRIELDLSGARELLVEQTATSWQAAVDIATGRMGRVAAREIERRRNRRLHMDLATFAS